MTSKQARLSMKENKWVNIMKSVQYPGKLRLLFLNNNKQQQILLKIGK